MKLRTKLYIGFAFILVLIITPLSGLIGILDQLNQNMNNVVKGRYEMVRLANNIKDNLNTVSREARGLLANPPAELRQQLVENKNKAFMDANLSLDSLERLDENEEVRELVLKLRALSESYARLEGMSNVMGNIGRSEEANRIVWYDARQVREQLFQVIGELQRIEEQAMEDELNHASETYHRAIKMIYVYVTVGLLMGIGIIVWVIRNITRNLNKVASVMTSVVYNEKDQLPRIEVISKDETGDIALAFNGMAQALEERAKQEKELKTAAQEQSWLKGKIAEMATMYPGVGDLQTLSHLFITKITPMVEASYGVFYIRTGKGDERYLQKLAAYADNDQEIGIENFRFGEGLVGQCAVEKRMILLTQVPDDYIKITSGIGMASPKSIILLPAEFEEGVLAVVELASFKEFSPLQQMLLQEVMSNIGVTIKSIVNHMQVESLLQESQALTEELQAQSEELQLQQEELRTTNEKLEEQYENSEQKTRELEKIKVMLEEKAQQLELNSQYKSEFLANMSHELRTPLNSLLILAQMLAENPNKNLTLKQVEYANTIRSSGNDLLKLINEILDLAKVESGKMEITFEEVKVRDIKTFAKGQFLPIARQKGIHFTVQLDSDVPDVIYTDEHRLQQILRNLLSNSFKFTDSGDVSLHIAKVDRDMVRFSVIDTGIGIPEEKQDIIFDAFRQADGTTSRKYGGSGLGLSISREFAQLLGGFIDIDSTEGEGSTFTLYLPEYGINVKDNIEVAAEVFEERTSPVIEPWNTWQSNEALHQSQHERALLEGKKILIVDDDMRNVFALTTALESHHMQVVFAENGREGIEVLRENPDIDLVLMDIMMPEMDGFEAIRVIRQIPEFQTLPVIALTAKAMKHDRKQCIDAGASDYISKPVNLDQLFSLMLVWLCR